MGQKETAGVPRNDGYPYCAVCGRAYISHPSGACRSCRGGKPVDWVAPEAAARLRRTKAWTAKS